MGGALRDALETVLRHEVPIVCAGRTDAGVHAVEQVAHFDSDATREPRAWLMGAGKFAGTGALLAMGLFPFIPGDLLKAVLAALLLPSAWKLLGRR